MSYRNLTKALTVTIAMLAGFSAVTSGAAAKPGAQNDTTGTCSDTGGQYKRSELRALLADLGLAGHAHAGEFLKNPCDVKLDGSVHYATPLAADGSVTMAGRAYPCVKTTLGINTQIRLIPGKIVATVAKVRIPVSFCYGANAVFDKSSLVVKKLTIDPAASTSIGVDAAVIPGSQKGDWVIIDHGNGARRTFDWYQQADIEIAARKGSLLKRLGLAAGKIRVHHDAYHNGTDFSYIDILK